MWASAATRIAAVGALGAGSIALSYAALLPLLPIGALREPSAGTLASQAEARFGAAQSPGDYAAAADLARRSLLREPMGVPALRVLALEAEARGAETQAGQIMDVAARRSLRDTIAQIWLLDKALTRRDFAAATDHADAVLRRRRDYDEVILPVMVDAMTDSAAIPPMVRRLATNPPWRSSYLRRLGYGDDPKAAQALLRRLNASASPVTDDESASLVSRLFDQGDFAQAHTVWLDLLRQPTAASAAAPYDGDFVGRPGAPPFNWRISTGDGRAAQIVRLTEGGGALYVRANAPDAQLTDQSMLLAPGRYRLTGAIRIGRAGNDRFLWRIQCHPRGGAALVEVQPIGQPDQWRSFAADFDVPAQDCAVVRMSLWSTGFIGGDQVEAWHRDLKITPLS